ncbi:hypothetical protein BDP27DRAFT_1335051 [Rhodocollybia butyracea]|uniref:Uncharacterized protein n=1 Tax=Rhodocollybia butyracea TaxID=206335 RepID=A0A9P5U2F9_9AGAR|nr:hypothetical protein BDP27DRAFT_1335051 [Rhodocollybia butyracea]
MRKYRALKLESVGWRLWKVQIGLWSVQMRFRKTYFCSVYPISMQSFLACDCVHRFPF